MSVILRPCAVSGRLQAPASKSHTHRAFILGALSGNGSITGALDSEDTRATLRGLEGLGFLVTSLPHETRVGGTLRPKRDPIQVGESGTTLRLLTALAALSPTEVRFRAGPGLSKRPMRPLLDALRQLGAEAPDAPTAPFSIRGPIRGGAAQLPGDVSSQFVSAILLAAPVAAQPTHLEIQGRLASRPYVDITLAQLRHHGVKVEESSGRFDVAAPQQVRQKPYKVPGDYSSAAFLLAAAAITHGAVRVENLRVEDPQGDREIVELLRSFGARVRAEGDRVTVEGAELVGRDVDVGAVPDLFPVLCVVAACARGASTLHGAPHLRAKESDRIHSMADNLSRAGIVVEERPDGIRIYGGRPRGVEIQSHGDHRIAMAMCVLALGSASESNLPDPNVIAKSYPNFLNDLRSIAPQVSA